MRVADLPVAHDADVIWGWENATTLAELWIAVQSGTYRRVH